MRCRVVIVAGEGRLDDRLFGVRPRRREDTALFDLVDAAAVVVVVVVVNETSPCLFV